MSVLGSRFGGSSRSARAVLVAGAALLVAVLLPSSATAADATLLANRTAWFWESNEKVTTCTDDGQQNVCGGASAQGAFGNNPVGTPISQGHLGIGVKDGGSDMRAYVKFDTGEIPFGATIDSFVARFLVSKPDQAHIARHGETEDSNSKVPATFNESDALIQVCAVAEPWGPTEGDPPSSTTIVRPHPEVPGGNTTPETTTTRAEPNTNCGLATSAKFSDDGKYLTADITEIAKAWAAGTLYNEGIALIPVVQGVSPNWTVELHGRKSTASSSTGTLTYVNEAEAARAVVSYTTTLSPPPPPPPVIDDGPRFPTFGDPVPVDPGPAPPQDFGSPPTTGTGGTGGVGGVPVASAKPGDTPGWFFGLFPLGLLVLGFVSGLVGPDTAPASAVGSQSRVASVLRDRRLHD